MHIKKKKEKLKLFYTDSVPLMCSQVQAWARQHQQRLAAALTELLSTQELLENLLTWLQWAESNLDDKDKEVLPQEIDEVKGLIAEHQASQAAAAMGPSQIFSCHSGLIANNPTAGLALCLQSSA